MRYYHRLHVCETYMSATAYKCNGGCHISLWTLSIRITKQVLLTALYDLYALGRPVAHAVGRLLATSAVRLLSRARSCGVCGEESGTH